MAVQRSNSIQFRIEKIQIRHENFHIRHDFNFVRDDTSRNSNESLWFRYEFHRIHAMPCRKKGVRQNELNLTNFDERLFYAKFYLIHNGFDKIRQSSLYSELMTNYVIFMSKKSHSS